MCLFVCGLRRVSLICLGRACLGVQPSEPEGPSEGHRAGRVFHHFFAFKFGHDGRVVQENVASPLHVRAASGHVLLLLINFDCSWSQLILSKTLL